jgi:hypothetical protein
VVCQASQRMVVDSHRSKFLPVPCDRHSQQSRIRHNAGKWICAQCWDLMILASTTVWLWERSRNV